MNRRHHAVSLMQAAEAAPMLAQLAGLARDSIERLKAVEPLIPPALRPHVQAGPIDGDAWCLLVSSSAAAVKLRQLLPSLEAALRNRGWDIKSIRIKVHSQAQTQRLPTP